MELHALQSVTLPLLMLDGSQECEGCISLSPGNNSNVSRVGNKRTPRLTGETKLLHAGMKSLLEVRASKDRDELISAIKQAESQISPPMPGVTTTFHFEGKSIQDLAVHVRYCYANLMNHALRNARLVFWSRHNGANMPVPAIFCPDEATAFFAGLATRESKLCANPKCRVSFVPTSPRQKHHTKACGVAARVGLMRKRDAKFPGREKDEDQTKRGGKGGKARAASKRF